MKQEFIHGYLLSHKIKPSMQRIAIMDYLFEHKVHPTVDKIFNDLYPQIPTLSKTTVYNTLKLFADQGAVQVLTIDEKNTRFDADISQHGHFKCKICGEIYDLPKEYFSIIPTGKVGEFEVDEVQVYYKGYCKKCRQCRPLLNNYILKLN